MELENNSKRKKSKGETSDLMLISSLCISVLRFQLLIWVCYPSFVKPQILPGVLSNERALIQILFAPGILTSGL